MPQPLSNDCYTDVTLAICEHTLLLVLSAEDAYQHRMLDSSQPDKLHNRQLA